MFSESQRPMSSKPQAHEYTLWFSLFSLKLNIFPFSASILTFSTQNHLILKYFTNFDTTHVFYYNIKKIGCIKLCAKLCLAFKVNFLSKDEVFWIHFWRYGGEIVKFLYFILLKPAQNFGSTHFFSVLTYILCPS